MLNSLGGGNPRARTKLVFNQQMLGQRPIRPKLVLGHGIIRHRRRSVVAENSGARLPKLEVDALLS